MQDSRQLVTMEAEDIVGISYQATASEDTAGIEDIEPAVVTCRMHELAIALLLKLKLIYDRQSIGQSSPCRGRLEYLHRSPCAS
jgi:hypothetical protein